MTKQRNKNGREPLPPPTVPDKLMPFNAEAEESVLGSLLIDPDAVIKAAALLEPQDFKVDRNRWVYEVILDLHRGVSRTPADLVTVSDELARRGLLGEAGGSARLSHLINVCPTSIHVEHYARIVARTAGLRRLINAGGRLAQIAFRDDERPLEEIYDEAEEVVFAACARRERGRTTPLVAALNSYQDRLERICSSDGKMVGIPTGLADYDGLTGGLQDGEMIVLAGRPSMGKTSLALAIALQAARDHGKRTALFSLEMSKHQITERLLAAQAGIDSQRLRQGRLAEDEWGPYYDAVGKLEKLPVSINDTGGLSALELRSEARRLQAEHGLDLLVIDYLQLMVGDGRSESRQQEMSVISRSVKALARELNVPVLALSQLSRECEKRHDKRPLLSDLRESGSIEQDSDVVAFLYRDDMYNPDTEFPNLTEIIVRKNRSGPTGVFSVYFRKALSRFESLCLAGRPVEYGPEMVEDWVK